MFAGLAWLVGIMLALRSHGLIDAATGSALRDYTQAVLIHRNL